MGTNGIRTLSENPLTGSRQKDVAEIMQVMDAAKKIMRQSGNMHQWGKGYPSEAVIRR